MDSTKSWLEVSAARLRSNYDLLLRTAISAGGPGSLLAVVKAGAYGHGAGQCARVFASAGAPWLGVTDAEEGAAVRRALDLDLPRDAQPGILVMCGPLAEDAATLVEHNLTPVVWTGDQIASLSAACSPGRPLSVHLEIDTGMSRQGVPPGPQLDRILDELARHSSLSLGGVMTHFASAEISSSPLTSAQQRRFEAALAEVAARGLRPRWIHAGNSSTIDELHSLPWLTQQAATLGAQPLLRAGLALYGYCLPLQHAGSTLHASLKPALTWKTRVLALEDVQAGATVGYNATFTTPAPMRLALLPVGYADGLRRELSSSGAQPGGSVLIRGQRAPVTGRISMNLTTVDVSAIPDAAADDEVIVLGDAFDAGEHARLAHTIPYEILCGLRSPSRLVP